MHLSSHLKKNYFRKKPKTIFFHNTIMHGTSYYAVREILWIKWGSLLPWLFYIWYCQSNKTYEYTASALQDFQCMYFLIQTKKPNIRLIHILHTEYPCAAARDHAESSLKRTRVQKGPSFPVSAVLQKSLQVTAHYCRTCQWRMKDESLRIQAETLMTSASIHTVCASQIVKNTTV